MIGLTEEKVIQIATEVFESTDTMSLAEDREKTIKAIAKVVTENNKTIYEQVEKMIEKHDHK